MKADNFDTPTNPYHYVLHCIGGKWKMTILHEIYTYGSIRFNQTLKILPISERCSASSSRSWWRRADPPHLLRHGAAQGGVCAHAQRGAAHSCPGHTLYLEYPPDARPQNPHRCGCFVVHKSEKYVDALGDIMRENNFWPGRERRRGGGAGRGVKRK